MRRPVRRFVARGCTMLVLCLFALGCESRSATVSGLVTYQGKPVPGGSVVFYCPDKQIVRGLIETDGRYSISNVPFGSTVVTVQAHAKLPEGFRLKQELPPSNGGPLRPVADPADTHKVTLPSRYALPEESGLSVIVDRAQMTHDIDLKP